ncbi:MAG: 50S ribosomal protein L29 [Candidatus Dependentiae bacterium]
MKVDKFKQELEHMGAVELQDKLEGIRRELFSLRLNASTAHIKDYSLFKKLRRDVARILTFLRNKQQKGN